MSRGRPVRGQNLTHQITHSLGVAIVTGVYSVDNPIPIEADLSRQFNASRSILREAVKMLTAKGLLGSRPKTGTRVEPEENWNMLDPDVLGWLLERKFSPALLAEFTEFRLTMEPGAASLAARMAGAAEHRALRDAIERMRAADKGDDDPLDSDIAFHVAVLRASRNRFYAQLTGFISTALRISIRTTNRYKGMQANVADHEKVSDAIVARQASTAGNAMRKIIQEVMDLINTHEELQTGRRAAVTPEPRRSRYSTRR